MVGKELMELDYDPSAPEKTILSTYVPMSNAETDDDTSVATSNKQEGEADEEEKEGIADLKKTRPDMNGMFGEDDDAGHENAKMEAEGNGTTEETTTKDTKDEEKKGEDRDEKAKARKEESNESIPGIESKPSEDSVESKPKMRFKENLSASQIEEAKATGRAQLGLAFEMLTMMKKRALKADPGAYQCLIDACGRVGDTKRATELLAKMHDDGIVADGTVYACLVSAFSAESAWKKGSKREEEDLPGKCVSYHSLGLACYFSCLYLTLFPTSPFIN